MTTDGKELLVAIQQVRHFLREVAGLLSTADGMMGESGWDRRAANTAISDTSASLQFPERWMPYMAFRLYRSKEAPNLMPSIAVVLESETEDSELVMEPIIVASVFDFGAGAKVSEQYYNYNHVGLYARIDNRTDDGAIVSLDPRQEFKQARCVAHRMVAFAHPLVHIGSSSALKDKVISPLLAQIAACWS